MEVKHEQEALPIRWQAPPHRFLRELQSAWFSLVDLTQVIYHRDGKTKHLVTTRHSEALLRVVSGANTAPQ